jgi:hypothetical protein
MYPLQAERILSYAVARYTSRTPVKKTGLAKRLKILPETGGFRQRFPLPYPPKKGRPIPLPYE